MSLSQCADITLQDRWKNAQMPLTFLTNALTQLSSKALFKQLLALQTASTGQAHEQSFAGSWCAHT